MTTHIIHPLDRPVWTALSTRHAHLAEGGERARRYPASIVPFAASRDDAPESLAELAALAGPGGRLFFLQADAIALPDALTTEIAAEGVQMVAARPMPELTDPRILPLGTADAPEMLDLAELTKPGPFTLRALELGEFWGVRDGRRLVAMAGERMKLPGWTELSGVCTHPDARGKGYARLLSRFVAGRIAARGETPFLHAYATNASAIRLYEQLGFHLRTAMKVAVAGRTA